MAKETGTEGTEGTEGTQGAGEGQAQGQQTDGGQQAQNDGGKATGDGGGGQQQADSGKGASQASGDGKGQQKGSKGGDGGQQGTQGDQGDGGEGEGSQDTADWRKAIEDADLQKQADQYNSVEDILRHAKSMRQKLSKALVLPGEDASDEDLQDFRTKLGVPESPDKYDYSVPDDLPDFIKESVNDTDLREDMEAAHKAGLTNAQFQAMVNHRLTKLAEADEAYARQLEERRAKADGQLRREWGKDYEANMNLAKRALDNFGGEDIMDWLTKTTVEGEQLANHPNIIRWAANVGRRMQEGNIHMEHDAGTQQTMQEQHAQLTTELHEARAAGDLDKAKRIDRERQKLSAELWGSGSIVGQDGRAA